MMEVYAAQLAYFDDQFGRLIAELKRSGEYDNTLIVFIQGDNGASGEGGIHGTIGETLNPEPPNVEAYTYSQLDRFGTPMTAENYPAGWGWAMNTPFQYMKQVASHLGGTRNGLVISWPKGIAAHGEWRTQYTHVVDVAPTLYEILGITPPAVVNGVQQMPLEGISFAYSLKSPKEPSRHRFQYYEMVGNRGWYEDGWLAVTTPGKMPWTRENPVAAKDYKWELYNLSDDYSQSNNLAKLYPDKLNSMKIRFNIYAEEHYVLPINNDLFVRRPNKYRPYATNTGNRFTFYPSDTRIPHQEFPDIKNRQWAIHVKLIAPTGGGEGALINQGGWFGGWGLFVRGGRPTFVYKASAYPGQIWTFSTEQPLSGGLHEIEARFMPESQAPGAGGQLQLSVDGKQAAAGIVGATVPFTYMYDGVGVGREFGTGLLNMDNVPDRYTGSIESVTVELPES
jgi:arylsulfatase